MNIIYIWDADYPWDVRVEKICRSLVTAGHEVHIVSRNLKRNPIYTEEKGLHIHRIKNWKNDKMNYFMSFPAFFNPFWKQFIDSVIQQHSIHIIIVRDLPMAVAGVRAGKRHGLPVVFDMAEDYVALLKGIWNHSKFKGVNLLVRNPYIAKLVERYVFKNVDHTLVVVEEAKNLVLAAGVTSDRISTVSNTPELSKIEVSCHNNNITGEIGLRIRKSYSAIYTGGIQKGRGIQTVIDAIPLIVQKIPNFLFVVVGDGYATTYFKNLAREKNINEHILWVGYIEHQELYTYITDCKIGVIPHFASEHVNSTVPNKLFDYMALGLPVLVSDALPLARIVREEKCGLSYKSGDEVALQQSLIELYRSDESFGVNAMQSVQNKYNWQCDEAELLRAIDFFGKGRKGYE